MDEILNRFGPSPATPPVAQPAPDEAQTHHRPHLAPAEVTEWVASVIAQEADAEAPPGDPD